MKFRLLITLLLLSFLSAEVSAQRQNLKFTRLSLEQGLSQSSVHTITQDKKGFLWIGTQDGLNRYDGYNFKVYKHIPDDTTSLTDSWINVLLVDSKGFLWVGTGKGLDRYDPNSESFIHYRIEKSETISLYDFTITSLYEDHSGIIWVGTKWGLLEVNPETKTQNRYLFPDVTSTPSNFNSINTIFESNDRKLWVGTNAGLFQLNREKKLFDRQILQHSNYTSSKPISVSSIYQDNRNNLWIGTLNTGIVKYDYLNMNWEYLRYSNSDQELQNLTYIRSIIQDQKQNVWFGAMDGGLSKYNPSANTYEHFRFNAINPNGVAYDEIRTLFIDKSNILWIGTYGNGINMYDLKPTKFEHFNHEDLNPNSLNDNDVWAILKDRNNNLWVGTNGGGLNKFDSKTGKTSIYNKILPYNNLSSDRVNTIYEDSKGRIWVGARNKLNLYNPEKDKFELFSFGDSIKVQGTSIWEIFEDSKGFLWIGTDECLNKIDFETKTIKSYTESPTDSTTIFGNFIKVIAEDNNGDLWIGTGSGLNKYNQKTDRFERFLKNPNSSNSISYNNVSALYFDKGKGILWIGTSSGLNRYNPETKTFDLYTEREGLPNSFIYDIIPDNYGFLWISTNKGLSKLNPALLEKSDQPISKAFRNYDVNDGLQSNEFNRGSGFKDRNGIIYFGGINGYNRFDPEKVLDNPIIPSVVITSLKIPVGGFNKDISLSDREEIRISHKENVFSIEFSVLDFSNPSKNQYAYKLEGFNENWIYSGTTRTTTYTNLNPGEYTFRVKGANNDNVWNETGSQISIIIVPPVWRTNTAYFIYGCLTLLSIWGVIVWRTKTHKREKELLARKVEEKTIELINRTEELEKSYEQLHKSQTYLIQTEKMASLGTLVAGIAHEINNPVNFISSSIMPLKRDMQDLMRYLACYVEYHDLINTNNGSFEHSERLNLLESQINDFKESFDLNDLKSEIETLLKGIETGSNRTTEIVKGLRIFSRSDGKDLKPADLHEGIDSTLLILSKEYGKRIQIVKDYGELPVVECYPGQLNQVFMNLLMNAVQAIDGDGKITIKTKRAGNDVKLTFRDTGKGIDKNIQPKIFDPFFTTKDVGKGTGLGLSISYGIIQKHGGNIVVNSEPEKGTEFIITLPIEQSINYQESEQKN